MKLKRLKIGLLSALLLMGCATQAEQMSQDYANHPEILYGYTSENPFYQRSFNNLVKASDWAVTDGLSYYYAKDEDSGNVVDFIKNNFIAVTPINVNIKDFENQAVFQLEGSSGVSYDSKLVKRFSKLNKDWIYEYWVIDVNQGAARTKTYQPYCKFIITKAKSFESRREIVYFSHLYFDQYTDPATRTTLSLSTSDYAAMKQLGAAFKPQCYPSKFEEMTHYVYRMKEDGTGYERNKISWLERRTGLWF